MPRWSDVFRILLLFAITILSVRSSIASQTFKRTQIFNYTPFTIEEVSVLSFGHKKWSPDKLQGENIPPGGHFDLYNLGSDRECRVKLRFVTSGKLITSTLINICRIDIVYVRLDKVESVIARNFDSDPRVVEFLFATDRIRTQSDQRVDFGADRSGELTLGAARVRVPEDHKIGHLELGIGWTFLNWTLSKERVNPRKHFIVQGVDVMDRTRWLTAAGAEKTALVFVHGFNTSFEASLLRSAQIFWDLQFSGTKVLFSWPSRGEVTGYQFDRDSALFARQHFLSLLDMLSNQPGIEQVHILAHSMGNLVVLDALYNYSMTQQPRKFGELIMAAPDVDQASLQQMVGGLRFVSRGMTLYASSADRALAAARVVARAPRAGDIVGGSPFTANGIDTIDVTAIGEEMMGLNHNVFSSNRSLMDDIKLLVQFGIRPPSNRLPEIRSVPANASALFWRFVP